MTALQQYGSSERPSSPSVQRRARVLRHADAPPGPRRPAGPDRWSRAAPWRPWRADVDGLRAADVVGACRVSVKPGPLAVHRPPTILPGTVARAAAGRPGSQVARRIQRDTRRAGPPRRVAPVLLIGPAAATSSEVGLQAAMTRSRACAQSVARRPPRQPRKFGDMRARVVRPKASSTAMRSAHRWPDSTSPMSGPRAAFPPPAATPG